jgi:hypothetical protein
MHYKETAAELDKAVVFHSHKNTSRKEDKNCKISTWLS